MALIATPVSDWHSRIHIVNEVFAQGISMPFYGQMILLGIMAHRVLKGDPMRLSAFRA